MNISVSSLCDNSGICGGIPSCCIAAPCEEIPAPLPEAWDTILSDDGDIPVSEVGEIGMGTGSTKIKESIFIGNIMFSQLSTYTCICMCSRAEMLVGKKHWQIQLYYLKDKSQYLNG